MRFIDSGCTLLNLALSGDALGGWPLGRISNVVGDRSSGKTLLAIEAATSFLLHPPEGTSPHVKYIETEAAFDESYASALGMPIDDVDIVRNAGDGALTIEAFYEMLTGLCDKSSAGDGYLVVLDSLDAMPSAAETERDISKGSYGMEKQKRLSELLRRLTRRIADANVHLLIISQIRQNISNMPFAPKWRRSGGMALDFYCSHIVWLYEAKKLKSKKTDNIYGIQCRAKVTKNKVSAPFREVTFPILFNYGIDDTQAMLKWLSERDSEHCIRKRPGGYYSSPWLLADESDKMRMGPLVRFVESDACAYRKVVDACGACWREMEADTFEETSGRLRKSDIRIRPDVAADDRFAFSDKRIGKRASE